MLAYLNQILPFSLSDERLQLRCRERVDQAGLRHDQEQNLCPREDR
jgi:hypothetical protein